MSRRGMHFAFDLGDFRSEEISFYFRDQLQHWQLDWQGIELLYNMIARINYVFFRQNLMTRRHLCTKNPSGIMKVRILSTNEYA